MIFPGILYRMFVQNSDSIHNVDITATTLRDGAQNPSSVISSASEETRSLISAEQRARMEANRLKALEKAASSRGRANQ